MIILVGPDGAITFASPPDWNFPWLRAYAETCTWCWSLAHALELSRQRRAR